MGGSHASICSCHIKIPCVCVVVSLESELESLRDALLKTRLDPAPSKIKSPGIDFFFLIVFNLFSVLFCIFHRV